MDGTQESRKNVYAYDLQGNLLSDGDRQYSYDVMNRLAEVRNADGSWQRNHYDGEGLRAELEENGRLVRFIYDGDKAVLEGTDSSTIRHIRGYELVSSDSESARTYYHYASDELGSITHVTDADGNVLNRYEYDAFGDFTLREETVENRFGFAGEQYDPVANLYYLRARFYNPVIGRFLQEDTYYGDGLNLYAYCHNNPVSYVDPTGHEARAAAEKNLIDKYVNGANKYIDKGTDAMLHQVYESGRYSVGDATFMDANDAFVSNISRRTDVDANGYFDVIAHGTPNGIQITHNGKHMIVDHRTAARLIQNSAGYNGQAIRLLSCNTGALDNGFAQNLANKLNVEVYAPTNFLWSTPNGNYFVAGMNNSRLPDMNDVGTFKLFSPGGN